MLISEVAILKSRQSVSLKCSGYRDTLPTDPSLQGTNDLILDDDSDHHLYPVICLKDFFTIALISNISGIGSRRRYVLSQCSLLK